MNGYDYSKRLSREQEYFREAIQKNKQATDKKVADIEAATEYKTTKQRDNFIKDKTELASRHSKTLDEMSEKSNDTIQSSQQRAQKQLEREKELFANEANLSRKDFNQRLNDIKNSYQKAFDSEKDGHQALQTHQKKKYDSSVNNITNDTDQKLESYQNKMAQGTASLKDDYSRERQHLTRSNEDRITDIQKKNSERVSQLKEKNEINNDRTREAFEADLGQVKNYSQARLDKLQKKFENESFRNAQENGEKNRNLAQAQQRDALKTNKEHQEQITRERRDFNKQLHSSDLDKNSKLSSPGESAEVMVRQQGIKSKQDFETQKNALREELRETQEDYQERLADASDNYHEAFKLEKSDSALRQEGKLKEVHTQKIKTISQERERTKQIVSARDDKNKIENQQHERKLMLERNNSVDRIHKLKEDFNTSMKSLEEKQKLTLEDFSLSAKEDRTAYIKKMNEDRNLEIFGIKRDFGKLLDNTVLDYEKRLNHYQRENESLKRTMDLKLDQLRSQTQHQMDTVIMNAEETKKVDFKNQQILMDQKDTQFRSQINQMNANFQRKFDKMDTERTSKLRLITDDYENKLKDLSSTKSKELFQRDQGHQLAMERVKTTYEAEKERLIQTFENQIAQMKQSHERQVEQLKDYKKLS